MPDSEHAPLRPVDAHAALLRLLKATLTLPAQVTFYASALGAIALMPQADPSATLAAIASTVGVNALSSILQRVARGDEVSDEELRTELLAAIDEADIRQRLATADTQSMLARLFRRHDVLRYVIEGGNLELVSRLTEQAQQHQAFAHELRSELLSLHADVEQLANRDQVEQIQQMLQHLIDSLHLLPPAAHPIPLQRPRRAGHFTGREQELARILDDLGPGGVVSLCGPGGVGKTALAAEAIWRLAPDDTPPPRFPDGVVTHTFYRQPQADLALQALARAYGEDPQPSPRDAARRALSRRKALIFLDGTEDADDLESVLEVCGSCGVLITSQTRRDAVLTLHEIRPLPQREALQLLRAWAGGRASNQPAAQRVCELVDGMPLAIRLVGRYLAAAHEDIAVYRAWLEDTPLAALHHGQRHHDSIQVLLSHDLERVSEQARAALSVIGLLALAPVDRQTVAAALGVSTRQAGRMLGELVEYGLLLRPHNRYHVSHRLIHAYARLHCPIHPHALPRLVAYYRRLASADVPPEGHTYDRLDLEYVHIVQILDTCAERDQWVLTVNLALAVDPYLDARGLRAERIRVSNLGLRAARGLADSQAEVLFLGSLGIAYRESGKIDDAIHTHQQALAVARKIPDRRQELTQLGNLGGDHRAARDPGQAIDHYKQAVTIAQELGDPGAEAVWVCNLANAYADLGQPALATEQYRRAVDLARAAGDRRGVAIVLGSLASVLTPAGEYGEAIACLLQALESAREHGDRVLEAAWLGNLGDTYGAAGQIDEAIQIYVEAAALARQMKDPIRLTSHLRELAKAYLARGDNARALQCQHEIAAAARQINDPLLEQTALRQLAMIYRDESQFQQASTYWLQALDLARDSHDRRSIARYLIELGNDHLTLDRRDEALSYYRDGLAIAREDGFGQEQTVALCRMGYAYLNSGDLGHAADYYGQALTLAREIGDRAWEQVALGALGVERYRRGKSAEAIDLHREAASIAAAIGNRGNEADHLANLGAAQADLGAS